MRIKSYNCTRFAGLKDIELEFDKGLNVILGPNESGKSTIIEGIHSTLFKNIKLRKNNNPDKDFTFKFMPQPNGDFIDGKVVVHTKNGEYEISKEWGSDGNINLLTPNGNIIKNEKDVNQELSNILTYGESTYSNIVFAKQRELKQALFNIINDSEISKEINDLLRRTLMELDGISVDSIQENIENEIQSLYKRWNREKNYPENNKGVNNPYKTGLGKILESYYNKENLKILMERADKTEKDFEDIGNRIKKIDNQVNEFKKEKDKLESIEDDVNNRIILEAKMSTLNKDLEDLKEANREWPKAEQLLEQLEESLSKLQEDRERINQEKSDLEKIEKKETLDKRLKGIEETQEKISKIIEKESDISKIKDDDIDKLDMIQRKLFELETTMKAGKMIAILKKSTDKPIYVSKDFGEKEVLGLDTSFEANGIMNITYADEFEIEIKTGEIDYEELNNECTELNKEYKELLKNLNVESLKDAKSKQKMIKELANDKKSLNKEIEIKLDNRTKEELEKELKELGDIKGNRKLEDIEKDLKKLSTEEIDISSDKKNTKNKIDLWKEKYTNPDKLFDLVLEKRASFNEKDKKLKNLKALPEQFDCPEEFKNELSSIKENLSLHQNNLEELRVDYYESKNNLLDVSYEELKREHSQAEKVFERNIRRGEKLLEIQRVFLETKENLSNNPMEPLVNEFIKLLEIVTAGSYKTGEIDEEFNIRLENKNGEIPIELLSAGTYDAVTLALRFSILKHIFSDEGGYVVLDDCLVDLDPDRKTQSIRLINDFAKDYQIIFTTCDPDTANMLGGKLIKL